MARAFNTLCSRFRPVFRYFFYENFTTPGTHFERRLAYTKSVATNSMIGYVLGLGDRHVQNILVDKTTAELGGNFDMLSKGCSLAKKSVCP